MKALFGVLTSLVAAMTLQGCNSSVIDLNFSPGVRVAVQSSILSVASSTVALGSTVAVTLALRDTELRPYISSLPVVTFSALGGTSTGTFSAVTNNLDGTYTANFTGVTTGTATTIHAQVNGEEYMGTLPTIQVINGAFSPLNSAVTLNSATVNSGSTVIATMTARDYSNNQLSSGGFTVVFSASGGTSTVSFGAVNDNSDGTYTAVVTGVVPGTATSITATINTIALTSTAPTLTVGIGPAAKLAFTTQPSSTGVAGAALAQQPVVTVQDAYSNTVTSSTASVLVSLYSDSSCTTAASAAPDSSASLSGTTTVSAVSGVTTFSGVSVKLAQSALYLRASSAGLTSDCSSLMNISAGAVSASTSTLAVSGSSLNSGSSVTVTLTGKDAYGNANPTGMTPVTFSSSFVGGTGTFGATSAGSSGVYTASFTGVTAGSVTLSGLVNGATLSSTQAVTVNPGSVSTIGFSTQPSATGNTDTALTTQPVVTAYDANSNVVTSYVSPITLTAYSDSSCTTSVGSGIAATTNPVTASSGVATFAGVKVLKTNAIRIGASDGTRTACSNAVVISAGAAATIAVSSGDSQTGIVGAALGSPFVAVVKDANANVKSGVTVAWAVTAGSGSLAGSTTTTDSSGLVTTTLTLGTVPGTNTVTATVSGLTAASFSATSSHGPATSLVLTSVPATATAGTSFNFTVTAKDTYSNTATGYTGTVAITSSDGSATLPASSTLTSGTNSFTVTLKTAGSKTVTAGDGTLTVTSSGITVSAGTAYKLGFSTQPSSTATAGTAFTTQPSVQVYDVYNNPKTTATNSITLAPYQDPSCGTNASVTTLTVTTNPVSAVNGTGIATFAGVRYNTAGPLYIRASATGLVRGCSSLITVSSASLLKFVLTGTASAIAGVCNSYTVSTTDTYGNAVLVGANTTVNLSGEGLGAFYSDSGCATPTSSVVISSGTSATTFYYKNSTVQSGLTFTATDAGAVVTTGTLAVKTFTPTAVAAGRYQTCAIVDGGVQCWGINHTGSLSWNSITYGTLGTGTTSGYVTTPQSVVGLPAGSGVTAISLGAYHGCAIASGAVKCWGYNSNGQLGNGTTTNNTAVQVTGLTSGATSIAAGSFHSCAVVSGSAYCWGLGGSGQLGNGLSTSSSTPVVPTGLSSGVSVVRVNLDAQGRVYSCAVMIAGTAYCWGDNVNYNLGDQTQTTRNTPVLVTAVTSGTISDIAINAGGACALVTVSGNTGVQCWGNHAYGIGNGTTGGTFASAAAQVTGVSSGATAISGGAFHLCVLQSGALKCWGLGSSGQVGDGLGNTNNTTPKSVTGLSSGVAQFSAGTDHTCAIVSGAIQCWGSSSSGAFGTGLTFASASPVQVSGLTSGATAVAYGSGTACAIVSGAVKCWGLGTSGQLGNGGTSSSSTPVQVTGITGAGASTTATSVAVGSTHACAVVNGGVQCWGTQSNGQLGNGTNSSTASTPVNAIASGSGVTAVSVGNKYSCALFSVGSIKCWGLGTSGQIGNGSAASVNTPTTVSLGGSDVATAISVGGYGADVVCATLQDGSLKCWGSQFYSLPGNALGGSFISTPATATNYPAGTSATAAGVAFRTNCIVASGGLKCWGLAVAGAVGNGSTSWLSLSQVVGMESGVTAVSAGYDSNCGIMNGGALCWGWNALGQLGNGDTLLKDTSVPAQVSGLTSGVTAIGAGDSGACAVVSGAVKCWGTNLHGVLGDGTGGTFSNLSPVSAAVNFQ